MVMKNAAAPDSQRTQYGRPSSVFKKVAGEPEEESEQLDKQLLAGLTEEAPSWSRSPENIKGSAIVTHTMLIVEGDWGRFQKTWRSMLMERGTLASLYVASKNPLRQA